VSVERARSHPPSLEKVRQDFDDIARLSTRVPDVLGPYEEGILRHVPDGMKHVLGCGLGGVARRLASRCDRVTAIDLAPAMIEEAARRSSHFPNIDFHVAEAEPWLAQNVDTYDCITAMAVLHHIDLERILPRIARALRLGGTFLAVDLLDPSTLRHAPLNALALCVGLSRNLLHRTLPLGPRRAAWTRHGHNEQYLTFPEARAIYSRLLPTAHLRQHLLWRYSIVWKNPG
jgi:SAM-dependent methyltransferase